MLLSRVSGDAPDACFSLALLPQLHSYRKLYQQRYTKPTQLCTTRTLCVAGRVSQDPKATWPRVFLGGHVLLCAKRLEPDVFERGEVVSSFGEPFFTLFSNRIGINILRMIFRKDKSTPLFGGNCYSPCIHKSYKGATRWNDQLRYVGITHHHTPRWNTRTH